MLKERIEITKHILGHQDLEDLRDCYLNQLAIMESLERMELLLEMTCSIAKNHEHKEQP